MKKALSITLMIFSSVSFAGEQTGLVEEVRVTSKSVSNHHTHVRLSGTYLNEPDCIDHYWKSWSIDTDTAYGKSMLSAILTAKASGVEVHFWGSGDCHADEPGPKGMEKLTQVGIK